MLDFGCGIGTYTLPTATIVGGKGKVYALDKDKRAIDQLMHRAGLAGVNNITRMDTRWQSKISLDNDYIDATLLFDVLHSYYFTTAERIRLLKEVHRISKTEALVLVYPKHMYTDIVDEIENCNFHLESKYTGIIVHDRTNLEEGQILIFKKKREDKK